VNGREVRSLVGIGDAVVGRDVGILVGVLVGIGDAVGGGKVAVLVGKGVSAGLQAVRRVTSRIQITGLWIVFMLISL